ncbi:MAG: hypothetical protein BWK80_17915 [Desulfobacteraceae bacterium IS3]|nr:MAG: hypothetical protein BWK80_17915 [Desulfobacteraceae bacterium IS3]
MQLNTIEQEILSVLNSLPAEKQQEILNFSLFLKGRMQSDKQEESVKNPTAFVSALKKFLKEVESDPFEIDTSVFDRNRAQESEREIEL